MEASRDSGCEDLIDPVTKEVIPQARSAFYMNEKSSMIIFDSLREEDQVKVVDKTAKEMWEMLAAQYNTSSVTANNITLGLMYARVHGNDETLESYLKDLEGFQSKLRFSSAALTDKAFLLLVLKGLPEMYDATVAAISFSSTDDSKDGKDKAIDYEKIKLALLDLELKVNSRRGIAKNTNEKAFFLKKQQAFVKKPRDMSKVTCYGCGLKGHFKADCTKAKDKKKKIGFSDDHSAFMIHEDEPIKKSLFYIDSGASSHMCMDRDLFSEMNELVTEVEIKLADISKVVAIATGNIDFFTVVKGKRVSRTLTDVYYVPKLNQNLLSVSQLASKGFSVSFSGSKCEVLSSEGKSIVEGSKRGKLYVMELESIFENAGIADGSEMDTVLLHRRLGHLSISGINQLMKANMIDGLSTDASDLKLPFCGHCTKGKLNREPFPKDYTMKSTRIGEIIHSDVCGPFQVNSAGGCSFYVTFTDDFSRYTVVSIIPRKSEVFEKFVDFNQLLINQFGSSAKTLRTDNGGEYLSSDFGSYLRKNGIKHERTVPYTPQQNGVSERKNRTIMDCVRTMLLDSGLAQKFWGDAVMHAVFIQNRCPTKLLKNVSPFEIWTGSKPNISTFRIFGSQCFAWVPKEKRRKLDDKSIECRYLGEALLTKGYRLLKQDGSVFVSRSVRFNEEFVTSKISVAVEVSDSDDEVDSGGDYFPIQRENVVELENKATPSDTDEDIFETPSQTFTLVRPETGTRHPTESPGFLSGSFPVLDTPCPTRKSDRSNAGKGVERYGFENALISCEEPATYKNMLLRSDSKKWIAAAVDEINSLKKLGTFTLVDLPPGRKAIGCKWIFKLKTDVNGVVTRYKARLVAQGFNQREGVDYNETFAPVVKFNSVRILLSIAATLDLDIQQMDVKTAFLYGELVEEIYMKQPEGFVKEGSEGKVCLLRKGLYGLKQSGRVWNELVDSFITSNNMRRCTSDTCVYVGSFCGKMFIIAIYVDDALLFADFNDPQMLIIKGNFKKAFKMEDLGPVNQMLGWNITRDRMERTISISQSKLINSILNDFQMRECIPSSVPISPNWKPQDRVEGHVEVFKYREAVGSLMYVMLGSRPDIAFAVGMLSRYLESPGPDHVYGVKKVIRYLKGTSDYALTLGGKGEIKALGYVDSDFAGDLKTRRSTTGYCFCIGNGMVIWKSQRQICVTLSTAEAEYTAACSAATEAVWIRTFLKEIGFEQKEATVINEDNQGCIAMSKNPEYHSRTKHIDIRTHFIREKVYSREITLNYIPTKEMIADLLTKGLPANQFITLRSGLGVNQLRGSVEAKGNCVTLVEPVACGVAALVRHTATASTPRL